MITKIGIDAELFFSTEEKAFIEHLSGWAEEKVEQNANLLSDWDEEEIEQDDLFQAGTETEEDLFSLFNGTQPAQNAVHSETSVNDMRNCKRPETAELLQDYLGPRHNFLNTMEDRERFMRDVAESIRNGTKISVHPERFATKLLYFFGHIDHEAHSGIEAAFMTMNSAQTQRDDRKRIFLEHLAHIPFNIKKSVNAIADVRTALESSLYGLQEVKRKVLEHLTLCMHGSGRADALLLVGPPGTGKTALASAIALAQGLPFSKLSFAGLSDILTLRGSNSSWTSATPGALLKEMCRNRCENFVFLLDEVDKSGGYGNTGYVINVLAELLDPRQNSAFKDLFMEFPLDFSRVLFILTANDMTSIPSFVIDRCSVIRVREYDAEERAVIIRKYMPGQIIADKGFNFEIEIAVEAAAEFAKITSLRKAREAVLSHVAAILVNETAGKVRKVLISKYDPKLVNLPVTERRVVGFTGCQEPLSSFEMESRQGPMS